MYINQASNRIEQTKEKSRRRLMEKKEPRKKIKQNVTIVWEQNSKRQEEWKERKELQGWCTQRTKTKELTSPAPSTSSKNTVPTMWIPQMHSHQFLWYSWHKSHLPGKDISACLQRLPLSHHTHPVSLRRNKYHRKRGAHRFSQAFLDLLHCQRRLPFDSPRWFLRSGRSSSRFLVAFRNQQDLCWSW